MIFYTLLTEERLRKNWIKDDFTVRPDNFLFQPDEAENEIYLRQKKQNET